MTSQGKQITTSTTTRTAPQSEENEVIDIEFSCYTKVSEQARSQQQKKERKLAAWKMQVQAPKDMSIDSVEKQQTVGPTGDNAAKTNNTGPQPVQPTIRMMTPNNSVNPASSQKQVSRAPASVWISGPPKAVPSVRSSTADHLPRNVGDAAWPPGRPPSSGSALIEEDQGTASFAIKEGRGVPMVTVDQSAITSGALRAWRSPSKPVSETELDAALKAALEGLPPSNRQVHPARPSNRGRQTMAHVPRSFDAEALRDPDAEVRVLHDLPDETQAPPRAPRYYSNQAANKRGRLTEQPQPRQVRAAAVAGQESECCERRNADNRPNGDEVLPPLKSTSASLEAVAPGDCVQPGIATVTPPLDGGVADGSPASPDTCRNLGLGSMSVSSFCVR